jgi:hypothetical protein
VPLEISTQMSSPRTTLTTPRTSPDVAMPAPLSVPCEAVICRRAMNPVTAAARLSTNQVQNTKPTTPSTRETMASGEVLGGPA